MNAVKKEIIIILLALLVFLRIIAGLEGYAGIPRGGAHILSEEDNSICHISVSDCGR